MKMKTILTEPATVKPIVVRDLTKRRYKSEYGLLCSVDYQPVIEIDYPSRTFGCYIESNSVNTTTSYNTNGFGEKFLLARNVNGRAFGKWAREKLAPLIARVADGMKPKRYGIIDVAVCNDDAADARWQIAELLLGHWENSHYYPTLDL